MDHNVTIGAKVKAFRTAKKYTLKQLSEESGLSIGFLSQLERGLSSIAIDSLAKLATILGVSLSSFFDSSADQEKSPVSRSFAMHCSQIERFRLVTRLGNAILSNGGEVFRAEQAMEYAARALRLEAFNAYVIANGIFSNVVIDGRFYSSRICHVPLAPTILCRVDALNDLSRKIAAGKCGPYEMRMRLEQIEQMKVIENRGKVLAAGIGSAGFCYLFQGSLRDTAAAFVTGVLLYLFLLYAAPRFSSSRMMQTIMTSSVLALCCCFLCWIGLGESLDHVMIGAVFTLAPGVPLTNSIRNFLENDYLSGLIRFVDAFLTAGCIAIGVGVALRFWMFAMGGML